MATKKNSRSKDPAALPIYAIARAVDMSSRELRDTISSWDDVDWDVSNHMKKLGLDAQREIEKRLGVEFVDMAQGGGKAAKSTDKKSTGKKPAARKAASKKTTAKKAAPRKKDAAADEPASDETSSDAKKPAAKKAASKKPRKTARKKEEPKQPPAQAEEEVDDTDYVKVGNDWLRETLKVMGFQHPRVSGEQDEHAIRFTINGADTEALLGSLNAAADTAVVESLQQVMARAIYGDRHRNAPTVLIDVQGFRAGRTKGITKAAQALISWARSNPGKRARIAAINTFDRHAFHNVIGDEADMRTESFGRGARRRLEVQTTEQHDRNDDNDHDDGNDDDE